MALFRQLMLLMSRYWKVKSRDRAAWRLLYDRVVGTLNYEGPLQSHAYGQLDIWREVYNGVEFDRTDLQLDNCMRPWAPTDLWINVNFGDKIDYDNTQLGQRLRVSPGITQRFGRHFSVELSGAWERMREQFQELYTAAVARTTFAYQLNTRAFVRAILQYSSYDYNLALYDDDPEDFEEGLFTQLLFSYKLNPQSAIYVGYSDASQGTQDYELNSWQFCLRKMELRILPNFLRFSFFTSFLSCNDGASP